MKQHFFSSLSLLTAAVMALIFSLPTAAQKTTDTSSRIKVVSYNIHHGAGVDGQLDLGRIGRLIAEQQADVVAIQELDSATQRTGGVYQLGVLADQLQLHATYGKTIDFQGGGYGIGILSKEKPLSVKRIALPGKEPRMLLVCEFGRYIFGCMHLSLQADNRMKALDILKAEAQRAHKPFIVAGDWNAKPDSKFITSLKKDFRIVSGEKQPTYPAVLPNERIDYIAALKHGGVVSQSHGVIDEPTASDHRPIWAVLQLKK
jgi:endonuclease/exonuclease/phosphatase family metal-dependent hydrolase